MKRLFTIFTAILFFLCAAPSDLGCTCAKTPNVANELKEADAVFSGKLVTAEYRKGIVSSFRRVMEKTTGRKVDYEVFVLKFEVERYWKGNLGSEVILVTEQTRDVEGQEYKADCEYPFEVGGRYLVYAYEEEEGLQTSNCTRTKELMAAAKDLKGLGAGKKPEVDR